MSYPQSPTSQRAGITGHGSTTKTQKHRKPAQVRAPADLMINIKRSVTA